MVEQNKEKLSVIIPTVNASAELDLAIKSLSKNSDQELELIVVVDPDQKTGKINPEILKVCKAHKLTPLINDRNLGPYGNWNKGAHSATSPYLVFATDDQYFAPHWDSALLASWAKKRLVAGRLVEPGIIPVWRTNLKKDFGTTPSEFQEAAFIKWCASRPNKGFVADGFFIPMLISQVDFVALGGYPTEGQFGTSAAISNDDHFIKNAQKKGYTYGTAEDSYSYHFQASSWKKKTLTPKIAAVILTKNEANNLPVCIASLKNLKADIHIVDSGSTDDTVKIAKKHNATIHTHEFVDFTSQRNYALTLVTAYDWVLFIDADEELEPGLSAELLSYSQDIYLDGVELPRKNFIFGKWIEHSDWYPDYRLVFVRPKMVTFAGEVHERITFLKGNGATAKSTHNLIHHNYENIAEFVQKNLISYPQLYAQDLDKKGVKFSAIDMVGKSIGEFMRRFFLSEGWRDGMYGLVLALLMGIQNLIAYLYLWEIQGKRKDLTTEETQMLFRSIKGRTNELSYWLTTMAIESSVGVSRYFHRARRKAIKLMSHL